MEGSKIVSGGAAEFVAREAEVRRERGAQHAALWQNLTRFPSVASGWLHPAPAPSASSSTGLEATIFTKQRDLVGRKNRLVGRSYQCSGGGVRAVGGFGWEVKDVQLSSPSPSRALLALVTNHTPELPSPQQAKPALDIWEGSSLVQHIPLQDCHGAVYADETFGSLVWSRDETRVAYLAEPKREEKDFPSYWDVTPKADNGDAKNDKEKEKERGKWHEFNEDWGETFPGKTNPRPHVVDLATGKVRALRVPAHISFGQLRWLPDGRRLLAVGWETTERRLGIVYCTNRRSAVYLIGVDGDDDGKLTRISADGGEDVTTPWSVPTPDGKGAVYTSSPSLAPHNACFALRYVDISAEATPSAPRTVVPIVDIPSADAVPAAFPGLYDTCGSDDYWLDDRTLVTPSLWGSRQVLLAINVDTGAIHDISTGKLNGAKGGGEVEGERVSWDLCDVRKGAAILAIVSSPSLPPTPCFGALDTTSSAGAPRFVWSLFPATTSPRLDDMQQQFATIEHAIHSVPVSQGEFERFEVVAIHQSGGEDVAKRRVLVLPHGGPHSTFPSGFQPLYLFFALQGYVVLLVNYRGSLGYGEKPLESLMGRCGSQDVADVMQAVDYVTGTLKKGDPTKLFVCGGSHGGFLTCHVVGQHPDRFTAAVARNPVVNIASMLSISDIPDWCLVEALGADAWEAKKEVIDKADLVRLWEASPIAHVTHVKTPTMVQISFDDRRVPPSQGREFYYALKRLGVPTRLLTYESNAHAIVKVESEGDAWINAALWFDTAASAN